MAEYWSQNKIDEYLQELNNEHQNVNADLHIHTTGSDGKDSPLLALLRAHALGLRTISFTDHNSIKGYTELKEQIKKKVIEYEEIMNPESTASEEDRKKAGLGLERLLRILKEMNFITGCEVVTVFKECPYVEILAYNVDLGILKSKLDEEGKKANLKAPGELIAKGLINIIKDNGLIIDEYFIKNRNNYKKLFFHELCKHPENKKYFEGIEGEDEEERTDNFAKKYIDNKDSSFYVDVSDDNKLNRKKDMETMIDQKIKSGDIVFDIEVIQNAGGAAGQFYTELKKHSENETKYDKTKINTLKNFLYKGLYNPNSMFYVDLRSTKLPPETVIKVIHESGLNEEPGIALVAHWGRYSLSNEEIFGWKKEDGSKNTEGLKNLEELIDMCDGGECEYPDNPLELRIILYNMCKEKGKNISIGGDDHGKVSKEGPQYRLGSQKAIAELSGLEWIKPSKIEGTDLIEMLDEEFKFRARLEKLIERKKELEAMIAKGKASEISV